MTESAKCEWIIQRCINAYRNEYEPWTGYCETLLTRDEMIIKLDECIRLWPDYGFRGHNVMNEKSPAVRLNIIS